METFEALSRIAERLENISFDFDSMKNQDIDTSTVEKYRERFLLFVEDSCPAAINVYMQKANNDMTLNDITKLCIMSIATRALEGKDI